MATRSARPGSVQGRPQKSAILTPRPRVVASASPRAFDRASRGSKSRGSRKGTPEHECSLCSSRRAEPDSVSFHLGTKRPENSANANANYLRVAVLDRPLHFPSAGGRALCAATEVSFRPALGAALTADDVSVTVPRSFFVAVRLVLLFEDQHKTTGAREAIRETARARSKEIARRRVSWAPLDLNGGASPTPLRSPWAPLRSVRVRLVCCKSGWRPNFACGVYQCARGRSYA